MINHESPAAAAGITPAEVIHPLDHSDISLSRMAVLSENVTSVEAFEQAKTAIRLMMQYRDGENLLADPFAFVLADTDDEAHYVHAVMEIMSATLDADIQITVAGATYGTVSTDPEIVVQPWDGVIDDINQRIGVLAGEIRNVKAAVTGHPMGVGWTRSSNAVGGNTEYGPPRTFVNTTDHDLKVEIHDKNRVIRHRILRPGDFVAGGMVTVVPNTDSAD